MTIIDFNDDGCTVYVLMLATLPNAIGVGVMEGRCYQFFPSIECVYQQIASDARHAKMAYDEGLARYNLMSFTTKFTTSCDGDVRHFNVLTVDRSKWVTGYHEWYLSHRHKAA